MDRCIAHKIKETNQIQTVDEHCKGTAQLMLEKCPVEELKYMAYLAGFLHDQGKRSDKFQNYILNAVDGTAKVHKGDVNHSGAGGRVIETMLPRTLVSKMIQTAIYSHHGLRDCLSPVSGSFLFEWSMDDRADIKQAVERCISVCDRQELESWCRQADDSANRVREKILQFEKSMPGKSSGGHWAYGSRDFFLGMYERLLLSLLIEGDRTDTASFMQEKKADRIPTEKEMKMLWESCIANLENHIKKLEIKHRVDVARKAISEQCLDAAKKPCFLYRLTVSTGGGKTFSSLRFALHHALKFKKKHIIYVAPYNSILEQNAEDIKEALGRAELVLEHHSNVVQEDEKEEERYTLLTENWESPVICTTAVQFLNTLFASGTRNVRRMYSICNSVILFDEVQALPVRIIELFNQAVNFLTAFGRSTVVLCSATQPLLDKVDVNRLCPPADMISQQLLTENAQVFKRTTLIDCTGGDGMAEGCGNKGKKDYLDKGHRDRNAAGFNIGELCDFTGRIFEKEHQVLVVVNTKDCARRTYEELKARYGKEDCGGEDYGKKGMVVHLSTNMCVENRHDILKNMKQALEADQDIICVSTQLIEAGVNISFRAAIRSLAGLDSIIQTAGRCNRHGNSSNGNVYIVKMSSEAENISRLTDIKEAQAATEEVLYQYRKNPEDMEHSLSSERAMELYYQRYFYQRKGEMKYTVNVEGVSLGEDGANLVDLLSANPLGRMEYQRKQGRPLSNRLMNQAFGTAGDLFQVIPEDGKIDVVAEYYHGARIAIDSLNNPYLSVTEQKRLVRKLQRYTVGISESMRRKIGNAIYPACGGKILVLSRDYYSTETGVSDTPCSMEEMIF